MKISNILILLIFNGILWSLITSMENEDQKDLNEETGSKPKDKNKKSNDEPESSGKAESQNEEPKPKINKNKMKGIFGREIGSKSNKFKDYYEEKEREIERKKQEDERLEFIRRLSEICAVIGI
ncbi:unnamed protein product [Meloidogyne enterolobii]|uniref:Uncharacterized protein n=1 Tax=Meloidogyne enterolobii TaxID=390850 RepID=A0ACB0YEV0_MELEN